MIAPEAYPEITEGLFKLNLSDDGVAGILGGNWLRSSSRSGNGYQSPANRRQSYPPSNNGCPFDAVTPPSTGRFTPVTNPA